MTDLRRVVYLVQRDGEVKDCMGIFEVRYDGGGSPLSASPVRLSGYARPSEMERLAWLTSQAMMLDPLYCVPSLVLDESAWDGTILFE
jgi:hypothetical protein